MSANRLATRSLRDPEALRTTDPIEHAVRRLRATELPALPVIDASGTFAGIFGEREFLRALFPGYLDQLRGAAFLHSSIDSALEKRDRCRTEPVERYMNREHVDVGPDPSDTQLAEIFLHHRVLVVPVVDDGRVVGVVTRSAFFDGLAERFLGARG